MSVWSLAGSLRAPARRPALGLVLLDEARGHGARARCPLAGGPGALGGGGRRRFLWRTLDEAQGWDAVGTAGRSSSGPNRSMGWRRPWASPSSENLLVSIGNLKLEDSLKVCTVFFSPCVRKQTTSSFFLEKGLVNLSGEMGAWVPGPSVLLKNLLPTSDALKKHK